MESADFDRLARSLVRQGTRRRVLAGALSAALGLLLPPAGSTAVRADRKHRRHRKKHRQHNAPKPDTSPRDTSPRDGTCPTGQKPCGDRCITEAECCGAEDCPSGLRCCDGVCQECCGQDAHCATGNLCTRDWCRADGVCIHEPANGYGGFCGPDSGNHSYCQDGQCLQCIEDGLRCSRTLECCGSRDTWVPTECRPHPIATDLTFCCRPFLGPCRFSGECCNGVCSGSGGEYGSCLY